MPAIVVFATAPDDKSASLIAKEVVEKRVAACAQVLPEMTSYYWWEGKLESSTERMIIIKTTSDNLTELTTLIEKIHPYDVPEVVALEIRGGAEKYLRWVENETRR